MIKIIRSLCFSSFEFRCLVALSTIAFGLAVSGSAYAQSDRRNVALNSARGVSTLSKAVDSRTQRERFIQRVNNIRSHHRPIPIGPSTMPFATDVKNAPAAVAVVGTPINFPNNLIVHAYCSVTNFTPKPGTPPKQKGVVKDCFKDAGNAVPPKETIRHDFASPVSEPTVAVRGDEVLVTGNWYAVLSLDAGKTFTALDPDQLFSEDPSGEGFCCDQVAIYDRQTDTMYWLMQGRKGTKGSTLRILVATGGSDIQKQNWQFYDLTTNAVLGQENFWFDFPDVAVTDKYLYISVNVFSIDSDAWQGASVIRIPKRELSKYAAPEAQAWFTNAGGSLRFTQGAADVMYWGSHLRFNEIGVWYWDDNSDSPIGARSMQVETFDAPSKANTATSHSRNKRPWLSRADSRITAGWMGTDGILGFAWTAGADNRFRYPHVRVAMVDSKVVRNAGVIGLIKPKAEPHIFSKAEAVAYPAAAPNDKGRIGISVVMGGPNRWPSHAVGVLDSSKGMQWGFAIMSEGRNTPYCAKNVGKPDYNCGAFGDYFTVRPHGQRPDTWVTVGYTVASRDTEELKAEAVYVWFGTK